MTSIPEPNPSGYCLCGCGERTSISPETIRKTGYVKGQPRRFLHGHYAKLQQRLRPAPRPIAEVFWERVNKSADADGCWEWTGIRGGYTGMYGLMIYANQRAYAHRLSWTLHNNRPIPKGMYICHHCDNPICVRPDHLFLGTAKDNSQDMVRKGRSATGPRPNSYGLQAGSKNSQSKLCERDIVEIRERRAQGDSYKDLSEAYGVHRITIAAIVKRTLWGHVP